MRQHVLCIVLWFILFAASVPVSGMHLTGVSIHDDGFTSPVVCLQDEYVLDQQQLRHNDESNVHRGVLMAQSFTPSMSPLAMVLLKMKKPVVIEQPLQVSIRSSLSGSDLTVVTVPASHVPYHVWWVEFDVPDIEVDVGSTYFIVMRTSSPAGESYRWLYDHNASGDSYVDGGRWQSIDGGDTWSPTDDDVFHDDFTFQTFSYVWDPDLECTGDFNWTEEVEPRTRLNGTINVANVGSPLSHLNWSISSWPYWGQWTFTPESGTDLRPEDGPFTMGVSVLSPNITNQRFSGEIKIVNDDDAEDFCVISVSLATPRSKDSSEAMWRIISPFAYIVRVLRSHHMWNRWCS